MVKSWKISKNQQRIFDKLLKHIKSNQIKKVLDVGSGRTSLDYLTKKFPKRKIIGIIHPKDKIKLRSIKDSLKTKNYTLKKIDFNNFKPRTKYDLITAHLFLGEANRFSTFDKIFHKLTNLNTHYLVIIEVADDRDVNYKKIDDFAKENKLIKKIHQRGKITFKSGEIHKGFRGYLIELK